MLAFVVLVFAYRYFPRAGPWLLPTVLLMCVGAVYDGYHYASDVIAGALLGLVIALVFSRGTRAGSTQFAIQQGASRFR
jgi:membrane-associated phospholipid phosphatase